MKKIIALVLAMVMLCSLTLAVVEPKGNEMEKGADDQVVHTMDGNPQPQLINANLEEQALEQKQVKAQDGSGEQSGEGAQEQNQVKTQLKDDSGEQSSEGTQDQKQVKTQVQDGSGSDSGEGAQSGEGTQDQKQVKTQVQDGSGSDSGEGVQSGEGTQNQEQAKKAIQEGLSNALTKVKNENARAAITRNLDRWMEKYQTRMEKMEDVEVSEVDEETGDVEIKAKEQVKWFGIIKGKATKKFEVDSKGNINEKAAWYSFLYADVKE